MNLIPHIIKGMKDRQKLLQEKEILDRKISILTNCINTLRYIQDFEDKHRLLKKRWIK